MERRQLFIGFGLMFTILVILVLGAESIYQRFLSSEPELLTAETIRSLSERGILITAVRPNSPAYDTPLQRGGVIVEANGSAVFDVADLRQEIANGSESITLTVLQGSQTQTIHVPLQEGQLGLQVDDGSASEGDSLVVDWVQIGRVLPDTPASLAGLEAGDVIVIVNGEVILTPEELITMIQGKSSGDELLVTVRRGFQTLTTTLILTASPDDETRPYMGIELAQ